MRQGDLLEQSRSDRDLADRTRRLRRASELFGEPEWYLTRWRSYIQIRAETVREFVGGQRFSSILDIGCGDGSASLPLLNSQNRLTLLDISHRMLKAARNQIPAGLDANVQLVNDDFLNAQLQAEGYDLILFLGLLAHVGSPLDVVAKIASLLKQGGVLIAESMDSCHPVTRLVACYGRIRGFFTRNQDCQNRFSRAEVLKMFGGQGLQLAATYRLSLPLPGMLRLLPQSTVTKLLRGIFGTPSQNRNASLGNEYIDCFKKAVH